MDLVIDSPNPDRTREVGLLLGRLLRPGDILLLRGELGAGKTTLTRAIAEGLGVEPAGVTSPTFVLINEYPVREGGLTLVHVDAYRLRSAEDLESAGWDRIQDHLDELVLIIEWPERVPGVLGSQPRARIGIEQTGETARRLRLSLPDSWKDRREQLTPLRALASTRCPMTGEFVPPDSPTWPFASERARMADLHGWLTERYSVEGGLGPESQDDADEDASRAW